MPETRTPIRFCRSRDGTLIAYAVAGHGPTLIKTASLASSLEAELDHPALGAQLAALGRGRRLVRHDPRGFGLSDRDVDDFSLPRQLEDLEAVAEAVAAPRYALVGIAGGSAMALRHAAAHPERVERLVIHGGLLVGGLRRHGIDGDERPEREAMLRVVEVGWGKDDPSFRQLYTSQFIPGGTPEQFAALNELLRRAAPAANAARFIRVLHESDQTDVAAQVRCPALVMHARGDRRVPFAQGRLVAAALAHARFVPLDSDNHLLQHGEAALRVFEAELDAFVPPAPADAPAPDPLAFALEPLSRRECEVLEQLARGLDNGRIGERIGLREKTVRNHVSTIFDKLGVRTRAEAIVKAREAGFGRPSE